MEYVDNGAKCWPHHDPLFLINLQVGIWLGLAARDPASNMKYKNANKSEQT
jgi:hypothetical protein